MGIHVTIAFLAQLLPDLLNIRRGLRQLKRALNHADIKTTTRYAHVLDHEVAEALERVQKSRNLSRNADRKVS